MLSFLRRSRSSDQDRVPPGTRVYVIGDIHGRSDLLAELQRQIADDAENAKPAARTLVYLGDYVDRGPFSCEVIDMLIGEPLEGFETIHLKGNHEDMMLDFLKGPPSENWLFNGGDATLASYGIASAWATSGMYEIENLRRRLQDVLPAEHLRFLRGLRLHFELGDYLFVHAGVRPGIPLERQRPTDLIWIRDRFLDSGEDFGKRVVHGHSITAKPEVRANRIGIDTGAFFSNRLTCLVLDGTDVRFLHT